MPTFHNTHGPSAARHGARSAMLSTFLKAAVVLGVTLLSLTVPRSVAQDSASDALTKERQEQTGTAITILFDNSGSMRGEKLRQAKSAFHAWLQTTPLDYKFSLVTFEHNATLQVPLGANTRDLVAQKVEQTAAISNTPICRALQIARAQIEKRRSEVTPYERHVVLIFTDGEENVDPRGINGVCAEIKELRKRMVEVVGIGFHNEGDYMNGVASRFVLANNEQELKQGLSKVDAEIGSADDVVVSAADLAALKQFKPAMVATSAPAVEPPAAPPVPAASSAPASAPVAAVPPAQPERGFGFGKILFFVVVLFVLRRLLAKTSR